jgi:hypothetical protein
VNSILGLPQTGIAGAAFPPPAHAAEVRASVVLQLVACVVGGRE